MMAEFGLRLGESFQLRSDAADLLIVRSDGRALRQQNPDLAIRTMLETLGGSGGSFDALLGLALEAQPIVDRASLVNLLSRLEQSGWLSYALLQNHQSLATLQPMTSVWRGLAMAEIPPHVRLSRFVTMRREGADMLVESSLGQAHIRVSDERLASMLAQLARPQTTPALLTGVPGLTPATVNGFLRMLISMQAVFCCDDQGHIAEDNDPALCQWEHHDLLFHTQSRQGRHNHPVGGSFRFMDQLPHEGAFKPEAAGSRLLLPRPALEGTEPGFFSIIEKRRSRRSSSNQPMRLEQLGTLLWYVARVQEHRPANPQDPRQYEATYRPCASAGGMHELELYLTVNQCIGLDPALYRYDSQAHALEWITATNQHTQALLHDACLAAGLTTPPCMLITLAARHGRVAWKYQSIAYALILKNVGAIYQQLYLVATAMGLAPCALGAGDAERFATATGTNYYEESSVGEFVLSSS